MFSLPTGVIGKLDGRIRDSRSLTARECVIETYQLGEKDLVSGYAVQNDLMNREEQLITLRVEFHQSRTNKRSLLEIEGTAQFFGCQAQCLALALSLRKMTKLGHRQRNRGGRRMNNLGRAPVLAIESRPPDFIPAKNFREALFQCGDVQWTVSMYGD